MNHRAFDDLKILIYGRSAKLPMDLEQRISEALPDVESRVDSFEDYSAALDHCKQQKTVGLFLAVEDSSQPPVHEIVRNLAKPYEKTGWPATAVLFYPQIKSVYGQSLLGKGGPFVAYRSLSDLEDATAIADTFAATADQLIARAEDTLIPSILQQTLVKGVESHLSAGYLLFHNQALNLLAPQLALSFRSILALRWYPVVSALQQHAPAFLAPHQSLVKIVSAAKYSESIVAGAIDLQKEKGVPLEKRLLEFLLEMNEMRSRDQLQQYLDTVTAQAKPGSAALIRQVAKQSRLLSDIAQSSRQVSG